MTPPMAHQPARSISAALRRERPLRRSDLMIPPGSVEMGPPSPRGPVFVRPSPRAAVDEADATAHAEPPPDADAAPTAPERPAADAAPTPEEPAVVVVAAAPDDAEPAPPQPLSPLPPDDDAVPPRHKPLQQRVSPRSVLLVPDEPDRTVDIDVYVEDEDEEHLDRLTTLRKRGYLAFYDRPPLMTVALVLSWIFIQNRRGYPPYDEDAYCLGPDTPFKTVFAHAYAHSSREHLYSNVVSMLLVGGVLEAVEGPLCVLCIFACAVPCGAAYHSLWKPHAFVRGASAASTASWPRTFLRC